MSLLALQDLLRRHREKATGIWRLGGDGGRTIYMEMGDIVFAQSGAAQDRLTAILVERGKLTQAQMDYALANLKPGLSIGKNLIEMGFITQRDLLDTARAQVERIVWGSLASSDEAPAFESRELESNIVRLPLDTPAMLLAGLLNLRDREKVLDLLGPVNQVVILEGRRSYELVLPQDLAKILTLLDGSRTILEISRESGIEPFRVGAFCLFLREMGWGRLHELPPLDRGALEQALLPEAEPLSPPLPEPASGPVLMAAIEAAAKPTTNLDHMAAALDALPDPISAPTPPTPLSFPIEEPEDPALQISEASSISMVPPASLTEPAPRPRALPWILLILAGLAMGVWFWLSRPKTLATPMPHPAPVAQQPEPPPSKPEPSTPVTAPPVEEKTEKAKVEPEAPVKKAAPTPVGHSKADRLAAIRGGTWEKALSQGLAHRDELKASHWTLRLEVACIGSTVQNAESLLGQKDPDLWLLPIHMRDGKTCYQVLLGDFASEAAAKRAVEHLPKVFSAPGNRPKVFQISELPDKQ